MTRAESQDNNDNAMRSWLVLMGIAASFLVWGLLVYVSVGDKGAPNWNFGVVEDIPGQSSYSTHELKRLPSVVPSSETAGQNATRQHVMEPPEKAWEPQRQGGQ